MVRWGRDRTASLDGGTERVGGTVAAPLLL